MPISGDYTYSLSDGNATITSYNGLSGAKTIPSTLDGYPVVAISETLNDPDRGGYFTSVIIPGSITNIGSDAFNCDCVDGSVTFLGNAPTLGAGVNTLGGANVPVYYYEGATGFTDPWYGRNYVYVLSTVGYKYVDLSVDTGIGTKSGYDADNYAGFFDVFDETIYNNDNRMVFKGAIVSEYRLRGSRTVTATEVNDGVYNGFGSSFVAWDLSLYGPWRLIFSGDEVYINDMNDIKNGIIDNPNSGGYLTFIPEHERPLSFYNMYLKSACGIGLSSGHRIVNFKGCTIISDDSDPDPGNNYGIWFEGGEDELTITAYDTIFSSKIGLWLYDGNVSFSSDKCVIDKFYDNTPFGTNTNLQNIWTAPTWPSGNAAQSAFNEDLLSVGINTPPEPGTSPYTGYAIGLWGTSRTGIGAMDFNAVAPTAILNGTNDGHGTTIPTIPGVVVTVGVPYPISATADSGYVFDVWEADDNLVLIEDKDSASTNATVLDSMSVTVKATFKVDSVNPTDGHMAENELMFGSYLVPIQFGMNK